LIALSTLVDFFVAERIEGNESQVSRKRWLWLSLGVNLGMLGIFKYFNFFISEFQEFITLFGVQSDPWTLSVILPVGISFYTFQTLSYTLDVYNKKMNASNSLLEFAAYVSFFPQLVAGPIERAVHLLPQFEKRRTFDFDLAKAGVRLIVWGLFKKIVIADSLAPIVNKIFAGYETASGGTLAIGAILFAFQIYGDFSGYSDIAIGTARLLGFDLMSNFKFPYFSRNIGEFWRRWHISLSTWFRDYLYIPLGGSRGSKSQQIRNIFAIFLVSGFWHGANWTFIAWGALHALLFLPLFLLGSNRKHLPNSDNEGYGFREWISVVITFCFVCIGWIFFRAESIAHATHYIASLFNSGDVEFAIYLLFPFVLVLLEWQLRHDERLERLKLGRFELPLIGLFMALVFIFRDNATEFIYFQF
jgi:D-alanyl-lipoteichoic acid acyltransferase DltB (MBOAT superfamily)